MALQRAYSGGGTSGPAITYPTGTKAGLESVAPSTAPSVFSPKAIRDYVDAQVATPAGGDWQDTLATIGAGSSGAGSFPTLSAGGSPILKGMWWTYIGSEFLLSPSPNLGPAAIVAADILYALTDNPGQNANNWATKDGAAGQPYRRTFPEAIWAAAGVDAEGMSVIPLPKVAHQKGNHPTVEMYREAGQGTDGWERIPNDNVWIDFNDGTVNVRALPSKPFRFQVRISQ